MKQMLLLLLVATLSVANCAAQKKSSQTYLIDYEISPLALLPENLKTFNAQLLSPLEVLLPLEKVAAFINMSNDLNSVNDAKSIATADFEKTYLWLRDPKLKHVESGDEDFLITLETSDVTVTTINPQSITELGMDDVVYRFKMSARLFIKDARGGLIFEKTLSDPTVEQAMTKAEIFLNPGFRMKAQMHKDNPEKLKKAVEKVMEHKGYFVLTGLLKRSRYHLASQYENQRQRTAVGVFGIKGKGYEEIDEIKETIVETNRKFSALSKKNRVPLDQVISGWLSSLPAWESVYAQKASVLEDKASQGIQLNCAVAEILGGDYDKAQQHLSKVPETQQAAKAAWDVDQIVTQPGTTLPFQEYAKNTQELLVIFREFNGRIKIVPEL